MAGSSWSSHPRRTSSGCSTSCSSRRCSRSRRRARRRSSTRRATAPKADVMGSRADDVGAPEPSTFETAWGRDVLRNRQRLWIVACIALAALAAVAVALAWRQYTDARERTVSDARARVQLTAGLVDVGFRGEVTTLSSVAAAPAVVSLNLPEMRAYFRRVTASKSGPFSAGLGWIDLTGTP